MMLKRDGKDEVKEYRKLYSKQIKKGSPYA